MAKVFISYRRTDSASISGRIYDRLVAKFGRRNVFKDVDDIPAGVNFGTYIQESLRECTVMLVVIGRDWLDTQAVDGGRRLDDPRDWVRIEVETAFSLGLTVIPLLVEGAGMPKTASLPESLQELAQIQGLSVRDDPDFVHDTARVIAAIERAFASRPAPGPKTLPPLQPESDVSPKEKPPMQPRQPSASLARVWRPLVATLAAVLVVGSFGLLLFKGNPGQGGPVNTVKTQTSNAESTFSTANATATATATRKPLFPYTAPAPGPGCDHGGASWSTDYGTVSCQINPDRTRLTGTPEPNNPNGDTSGDIFWSDATFPTDYSVSVQVTNIAGGSRNHNIYASFGILIGVPQPQQGVFYLYWLFGDGTYTVYRSVLSGTATSLATGSFDTGIAVTPRLIKNGRSIVCQINSVTVGSYTEPNVLPTHIVQLSVTGVYSAVGAADFSNFTIG